MKRIMTNLRYCLAVALCTLTLVSAFGGYANSAPPRIPANAPIKIYTVQAGDSAWSIAEEFYGRGEHYKIIYNYNGFTGDGPFLLSPGQKLKLPVIDAGPEARVGWLHRDVRARAPRAVDWLEAREQMSLWRLYRVATGDESAARIVFEDDSDLKMREKALLVIYGASATTARTGANPGREITVEAGTVVAGLAALGDGGTSKTPPIAVKTPSGSVGILGLAIQVQVDAAVTAVSAMVGEATVTGKDEVVPIPERYGTVVEKGKRPEKPRPLPDSPRWVDGTRLAVVSLVRPGSNGGLGRVEAEWMPVADAGAYRVEVAADKDFKSITYDAIVDHSVTGLRLEALELGTWWVRVAARTSRGLEGLAGEPVRVVVTRLESPQPPSTMADGTMRAIGFVKFNLPANVAKELTLHLAGGPQAELAQDGSSVYLFKPGRHRIETLIRGDDQVAEVFEVEVVEPTITYSPWPRSWPNVAPVAMTMTFRGPEGEHASLPGLTITTSDGEQLPVAVDAVGATARFTLPTRDTTAPTRVRIAWAGGVLHETELNPSHPPVSRPPSDAELAPLPGSWRRGGHTPSRRGIGTTSLQFNSSVVSRDDSSTMGELSLSGDLVVLDGALAIEASFVGQEVFFDGPEASLAPSAQVGDLWAGARGKVVLAPDFTMLPAGRLMIGLGLGSMARHGGVEVGATLRWRPTRSWHLDLSQSVLGTIALAEAGHEIRSTTTAIFTWAPLAELHLTASWQLAAALSAGGDRDPRGGHLWNTAGVGVGVVATPWLRIGAAFGLGIGADTRADLGALSGRLTLDFVTKDENH